ncbi:MAG TPA: hypothetical protein VGK16_05480 [Candidatus Limnocylindrales bacterium]|jgi:hypothetical protein
MSPSSVAIDRAAAVDLVLARLRRAGSAAELAPPRTKNADVLVLTGGQLSRRVKVKYRKSGPRGGWLFQASHEDVRDDDLVYALVDLEPDEPAVYVLPAQVVADALATSHGTWLDTPSRGSHPHRDNPMRQVMRTYSFPVPGFEPDWLDRYHERWDLVLGEARLAASPTADSPGAVGRPAAAGGAYRRPDENVRSKPRDPFAIDPDEVDRGLKGHRRTQNALFDWLATRGVLGLSPDGIANYDIAWREGGRMFVGEVKSLTVNNEAMQLRLGLGQALHYAEMLRDAGEPQVQPVLIAEHEPTDGRWLRVCDRAGVILTWPGGFDKHLTDR